MNEEKDIEYWKKRFEEANEEIKQLRAEKERLDDDDFLFYLANAISGFIKGYEKEKEKFEKR